MLRILTACSATVRKSLQGLDYFAADGASAFDDLATLLNQHSHLIPVASLERWQGTLKNAKLYLKGDFKVSCKLRTRLLSSLDHFDLLFDY